MEEKSKEYLEKRQYLEDVYRVRTFIIRLLHHFNFKFAENKDLVPKPNWHNRILSTGAIGLVCWKNGLPMSLQTPWGEIRFIDIDFIDGFCQNISEDEAETFMKEMNEMFNLTSMGSSKMELGCFCPLYSIGQLPWSSKYLTFIERRSRSLGDDEQLLLDTYKEGKQLCIDIFGRQTAV